MAERGIGIGRGLASILPERPAEPEVELRELPVEIVRANPDQPRKRFDPESLEALAGSVAEVGVVQPIVVRPLAGGGYEVVAGERRWRAAIAAGLATVPAVVRDDDELRRREAALVENMVREDLNPVEAARAVSALADEVGLSHEDVARKVGRSRSSITNLVRLLELPDATLELLEDGALSEGHGRAVLQAPDHDARRRLAREAAKRGWSVRETERRARAAAESPRTRRRPRRAVDPDQEAARREVEDALGAALGLEVAITLSPRGAVAELRGASLDDLQALARRLGDST